MVMRRRPPPHDHLCGGKRSGKSGRLLAAIVVVGIPPAMSSATDMVEDRLTCVVRSQEEVLDTWEMKGAREGRRSTPGR